MDTFITFGVQYKHEPHPTWQGCDPDGYVRITGCERDQARAIAFALFGQAYAFDYGSLHDLNPRHYPRGEIGTITVELQP